MVKGGSSAGKQSRIRISPVMSACSNIFPGSELFLTHDGLLFPNLVMERWATIRPVPRESHTMVFHYVPEPAISTILGNKAAPSSLRP